MSGFVASLHSEEVSSHCLDYMKSLIWILNVQICTWIADLNFLFIFIFMNRCFLMGRAQGFCFCVYKNMNWMTNLWCINLHTKKECWWWPFLFFLILFDKVEVSEIVACKVLYLILAAYQTYTICKYFLYLVVFSFYQCQWIWISYLFFHHMHLWYPHI